MLKFLSRKKAEPVPVHSDQEFKDWRNGWGDVEALSQRLDHVRARLPYLKEGTWSYTHWHEQEQVLLRKWKLTVQLYQSGLRQRGPQKMYDIDYAWWEGDDGMGGPALPIFGFFNDLFTPQRNLDWSWAKAQEEKLQKARQGLA